jgi:hypothetical protein
LPEPLRRIPNIEHTIERIRDDTGLTRSQIEEVLSWLHTSGLLREDQTYNGWTNYETWCVHLWLTNEEGPYRHCRGLAHRAQQAASDCEQVREEIWTEVEARRFLLADAIKEFVEELHPLASQASMFSDLLGTALHDVDWHEIAGAFLEDVGDSDSLT